MLVCLMFYSLVSLLWNYFSIHTSSYTPAGHLSRSPRTPHSNLMLPTAPPINLPLSPQCYSSHPRCLHPRVILGYNSHINFKLWQATFLPPWHSFVLLLTDKSPAPNSEKSSRGSRNWVTASHYYALWSPWNPFTSPPWFSASEFLL